MDAMPIGKSVRRLDYETKVTGGARYLADMSVPGMCHGKILRSPYAHARIKRIDVSKALKVAGVMAVLTRDDILARRRYRALLRAGVQRSNDCRRGKSAPRRRPGGCGCRFDCRCGGRGAGFDRGRLRRAAGGARCSRVLETGRDLGARLDQIAGIGFCRSRRNQAGGRHQHLHPLQTQSRRYRKRLSPKPTKSSKIPSRYRRRSIVF